MNKTRVLTPQVEQQRRHTRIPFDAEVRLHSTRGTCVSMLVDISLKGALLERPKNWPEKLSETCVLEVLLSSNTVITMQVRVAHMTPEYIGFQCIHIDLDSMTHLRRLVELNLGDEQQCNRELSSLACASL